MGVFPGLFLGKGLVIGLSGRFLSARNSLAMGVEKGRGNRGRELANRADYLRIFRGEIFRFETGLLYASSSWLLLSMWTRRSGSRDI